MTKHISHPKLDNTVRPQDDFYRYVINDWSKNNPIPGDQSRWSVFHELHEKSLLRLRTIFEELQGQKTQDATSQQARDFYHSSMYFDKYSKQHWDTVNAYIDKINAINNTDQLSYVVGELHRIGVRTPWANLVDTDDKDAKKYLVRIQQAGLSLPDRDYYLSNEKTMVDIRDEYKKFIGKVHELFGDQIVLKDTFVSTIFELESKIAKIQRTNVQLRDVDSVYNPIKFDELRKIYANINWDEYARGTKWANTESISQDQPEFIDFINTQFTEDHIKQWQIYLKWKLLCKFLPYISTETSKTYFEFFGVIIGGRKEMTPLWKKAVSTIEYCMGENVGKLYVKDHFTKEAKEKVENLVSQIKEVLNKRIGDLDWMSKKTKAYAIKKLNNLIVIVGYPDEWRDFSDLSIVENSLVDNIINSEIFNHDYEMSRLGQVNIRNQWLMSPQTVNAYHDPNRLVICFPAGILHAPMFDVNASDAQNLGGIGTIIGHEISHAFDDQGCQFDADGNVRVWQMQEERKAFSERAKLIIDQADQFEALPGLNLKGDLVIGESIADLGGLEFCLEILNNSSDKSGIEEFFINYTFTRAESVRAQMAREFALTDPHPPEEFRVNAMLQHLDSFYEAYDVKKGDKLYRSPEKRAKIW